MTDLSFTHRFVPGTDPSRAPLVLLHGTGGDENDLLSLGEAISPGAPLLSPRGRVLENGMPRFFRRLREGVFDEADVIARANELADFLAEARHAYGLRKPVAVGFSNGANIAAAMLFLRPEELAGAALLRAMVPLSAPPAADLRDKRILMLNGSADPIIPADNAARLAGLFERNGAHVDHRTLPTGHGLTQTDVTILRDWLE